MPGDGGLWYAGGVGLHPHMTSILSSTFALTVHRGIQEPEASRRVAFNTLCCINYILQYWEQSLELASKATPPLATKTTLLLL